MNDNPYLNLAEETRKLYDAYRYEGFTESESLELVSSQYAFAVINTEVENRRKASKRELMERMRKINEKYRKNTEDKV